MKRPAKLRFGCARGGAWWPVSRGGVRVCDIHRTRAGGFRVWAGMRPLAPPCASLPEARALVLEHFA